MTITLTIDNLDALPDGGPARFQASRRSFRIGRDKQLDWSLPDPSRFISSRHCEVHFENGGYWLHDGSTNGVFLNGAGARMASPHRLAHGDRLRIGPYTIRVAVDAEGAQPFASPAAGRPAFQNPAPAASRGEWDFSPASPAPVPPREARHQAEQTGNPGHPRSGGPGGPAPLPHPGTAHAPGPGAAADRFVRAFCAGAGIAPEALAHLDPEALAREAGEFARLTAEGVSDLLRARAAAKAMTKSASRTVVSAADNNPLKHVPTAGEAVEVMFGRRRPGYLDARRSLADGFADLKRHELATYAAMQQALGRLLDPLSPESVEVKAGSSAFASRKSQAWDIFKQRWEERDAGPNGMLDAFLGYFAEAYDAASRPR